MWDRTYLRVPENCKEPGAPWYLGYLVPAYYIWGRTYLRVPANCKEPGVPCSCLLWGRTFLRVPANCKEPGVYLVPAYCEAEPVQEFLQTVRNLGYTLFLLTVRENQDQSGRRKTQLESYISISMFYTNSMGVSPYAPTERKRRIRINH